MSDIQIINPFTKTYLIGPMEKVKANDSGRGWRDKIRPELESRVDANGNPVYVFDPTLAEAEKVGFSIKEYHSKMEGWIASGNMELVRDSMDVIWRGKSYMKPIPEQAGKYELVHILGDLDYVRNSTFLIARLEEGDEPCGTYGEALLAFERRIPIYLIQTMAKSKYNKSFLGWVYGSGGDVFENPTQLIEFLDKTYKLKVKK